MPTADNRTDPFEFEPLPEDQVAAMIAEREDQLATRNAIDYHRERVKLRNAQLLALNLAGADPDDIDLDFEEA